MIEQSKESPTTKNIGLRGIVVADSTISKVDGEQGNLIYRGYDILSTARNGTYEEIMYLLLWGTLPDSDVLELLRKELVQYRRLPSSIVDTLKTLPKEAVPMDVLQAMVPALAMHDPKSYCLDQEECRRNVLRLIVRLPLLMSAWDRIRNNKEVVEPLQQLGHAANFLFTLHGKTPSREAARIMDVLLILHADHGFNASTFTARQVASTRAHVYAAISAAVGSLSGPLHGGATFRVYQMFKEIGAVNKVREYVTKTLDNNERIMGMGHAVYKVTDPRAEILGPMAADLAEKAGKTEIYKIAEEVRRVTTDEMKNRKGREIYANVDFYSAIVYSMMDIPEDLFTPIFAIGRVAGWAAHYVEERFGGDHAKPTLYRPRAEYVGRYCGPDGCDWKPIDGR